MHKVYVKVTAYYKLNCSGTEEKMVMEAFITSDFQQQQL